MVIYFTGTGNSRYAAKKIAASLNDEIVDSFGNIKNNNYISYHSDTPYVFVCPTYAWRIPRIFENFIRKSSFCGSSDAYFVMTCGGDIGNAGHYLKALCSDCSLNYKGVSEIVMPENYTAMFAVPNQEEADKIVAKAEAEIRRTIDVIQSSNTLADNSAGIGGIIKSSVVNAVFYPVCVKADAFRAEESCISCGKCEALCPLNNIKITDLKPVWGKSCTHCMACINACPVKAIEYGKASVGKPRYYNLKSN